MLEIIALVLGVPTLLLAALLALGRLEASMTPGDAGLPAAPPVDEREPGGDAVASRPGVGSTAGRAA
jgi:hypothetical protein